MKTATNTASSASTTAVPPLNLTRTGKVPAVLNGIPAQPKPTTSTQLTAAQRGPGWMARYNCPAWCVLDHAGKDGEPGWHQGAGISMDPPPLQDDDCEGDVAPFLTARITQANESPELFGVETRLWLDINDVTHELDLRETDRFIERTEKFLPLLKAMRDRLADAMRDDRPRNEEAFQAWLATPLTPQGDA